VLEVNPFYQPNVNEAKDATSEMLEGRVREVATSTPREVLESVNAGLRGGCSSRARPFPFSSGFVPILAEADRDQAGDEHPRRTIEMRSDRMEADPMGSPSKRREGDPYPLDFRAPSPASREDR
jgi:hypothetical protein